MKTITLYHGSTQPISHPLVDAGREDLDFGRGFYLTHLKEQAESWARRMQLIRAAETAYVNEYLLDIEQALKDGYTFFRMEAYDREWLDFIVDSRSGKRPWKPFDLIEGGVANDRVIDTVEDYISGLITVEQALGLLVHKEPNHQLCILNQEVIERHLTFQRCTLI